MEDFSELVPEEKHRFLMCCIMGLLQPKGSTQFPNPLFHLGYEVIVPCDRLSVPWDRGWIGGYCKDCQRV
jgi:hypothetical protein